MFQNLNTFEMINSAWKGFPDYTVVLLPLPESSQLVGPSSQPEVEPRPLVVKALTPNHWTCREFPVLLFVCFPHVLRLGIFLRTLRG